MNYGRWYPTCTTLADGKVLVVAGTRLFEENIVHVRIPEIYDPDLDTWVTLDFADKRLPLYPFMFLLPEEDKVFFAGQGGVPDHAFETFVLDTDSETWDLDIYTTDYLALGGSAVMYEPGKIMRIGGNTNNVTKNTVELINFNDPNPEWKSNINNGGVSTMITARYDHQAVLLADGTVLVIGGRAIGGPAIKLTELYDPATDTWTAMDVMTYNRFHHAIALLSTGW